MQWSGNNPPTGLTPAMRKEKDQDRLNKRVLDAVAHDPAYQITTVDGTHWICPFTGLLAPTAGDWRKAAQRSLFDRLPWASRRNGKARPVFQVLVQKWTIHLTATQEGRLMAFDGDGRWLHPDTGVPVFLPKARAATDATAIAEIAHVLAGNAELQLNLAAKGR